MFNFLVLASILFLMAESASSSSSVKNLKNFNAFEKIEGEDFNATAGNACVSYTCPDLALGYTQNDAWAAYYGVDFEDGAELVTFRLRGFADEVGYVYLRLGSSTADPPAAAITVSITGNNNCNFYNFTSFLPALITGVQDLYLTFYSPYDHIVTIDWFQFVRKYD